MNRIVLGCSGIALAVGLSACDTNFKATDKLMRNQHRVVQNTRVYQEPTVQRQVVQQVQQPVIQQVQPIVQQVQQPVIQQVETTVVEQETLPVQPLEPKIVTRTVTKPPIYKTVYIDGPTQVVSAPTQVITSQRINVRTLTIVQIRSLQRSLAAQGLYTAPIDGIFGIKTAQALAAYQRQVGTTGPITIQILEGLGITL